MVSTPEPNQVQTKADLPFTPPPPSPKKQHHGLGVNSHSGSY